MQLSINYIKIADLSEWNSQTIEVVDVFNSLFTRVHTEVDHSLFLVCPTLVDNPWPTDYRDGKKDWEMGESDLNNNIQYYQIFDIEYVKARRLIKNCGKQPLGSCFPPEDSGLEGALPAQLKQFVSQILAEFSMIITHRQANGDQWCFLEHLFQAYKLGAFPFGWTGNYPDAVKLKIYFPECT